MTARKISKIILSIAGICLLAALWDSQVGVYSHSGWYLIAVLLAVGGALPRETAVVMALSGTLLFMYFLFYNPVTALGVTFHHVIFLLLSSVLLYVLATPEEAHIMKCPHCFWQGPSTSVHFSRCPRCGQSHLRDADRMTLVR
jgi:predicted membrane protein